MQRQGVTVRRGADVNKTITIRDVAEKAGVSVSAVHIALNGKKGVGEEKKVLIKRVAAELGYQPNAMASMLKQKRKTIAILLPSEEGDNKYFFPQIWQGIHDVIQRQKVNFSYLEFPYSTANHEQVRTELLKRIQGKEIDGLLTAGHEDVLSEEDWELLESLGTKIVVIHSEKPGRDVLCCIEPNYDVIGRTMAELISSRIAGYGSIFIAAGNPKYASHNLVMRGFERYLRENQIHNMIYRDFSWTMDEINYIHILREISRPDVASCCAVFSQGTILLGRALEESGKATRLFSLGTDLSEETARRLKEGIFDNVIQKNPYAEGYLGLWALIDYFLNGNRPERKIYVGADVVFRSNIEMYQNKNHTALLLGK